MIQTLFFKHFKTQTLGKTGQTPSRYRERVIKYLSIELQHQIRLEAPG